MESGSSKADVYDVLKLPLTQPSNPVNVQHAASASTSAEQDIVDQFVIVANLKLHNEYSDGDDNYCPLPLDWYSEMGLIKSNVNYDDDSAFADREIEEDMSYIVMMKKKVAVVCVLTWTPARGGRLPY